jgi:hypothetical protein
VIAKCQSFISVVAVLTCLIVSSCSTRPGDVPTNVRADKVERIASELRRCPLWIRVPAQEVERRKQITDVFSDLAKYDTSTIRAGIVSYLNSYPAMSPQADDAGHEVFAFLRVVFVVPHRLTATRENPPPFSRQGNPVYADGMDMLWPFSMDDGGRLRLTGVDPGFQSGLPMGHFTTSIRWPCGWSGAFR